MKSYKIKINFRGSLFSKTYEIISHGIILNEKYLDILLSDNRSILLSMSSIKSLEFSEELFKIRQDLGSKNG